MGRGESAVDGIEAGAAARALEMTSLAGPLQHLRVTESTNKLALEAAQAGARRGVWIADEQTAGRGRGGHSWLSAPGDGLYVSVLATPQLPLAQALWLSLATGLAAQRAVRDVSGLEVDLRWPNDLLANGRKCGGILVESAVENGGPGRETMLRYAVIGIGINVHHAQFPEELAEMATSLRMEGATAERQSLLVQLLRALDRELDLLEREQAGMGDRAGGAGGAGILKRFEKASSWVRGKRVHVPEEGGYTGVTAGLNEDGFLRVEGEDGRLRTVLSGGVRGLER
jgi:BirA family biotin operon repressor/biotin-[acetyl-CoA-carboxylase] ligase